MVGTKARLAAAAVLCSGLAGCVSSSNYDSDGGRWAPPQQAVRTPRGDILQCVPYARDHSGVKIWGDAYLWWDKAEGRYAKRYDPSEGAVMVLNNYAGPNRGHVAIVREVISGREIRVDHANWLDDGTIFTDDPVRDVSAANDWSLVRVFNMRLGTWGTKAYPVQGFIGPDHGDGLKPERHPEPNDDVVAEGARPHDPIAALLAAEDAGDPPQN